MGNLDEQTGKMATPASPNSSSEQGHSGDTGAVDPPVKVEDKAHSAEKSGGDESDTPHHPIAEFLYQLTKMLQDDNDDVIEWSNGRIKVQSPERLEAEVLHRYFRHSKFASFQRQLNYFGFRKIAGKGKMAPCSYVNENCTADIKSLLHIKRKTNGSAARKAAMNRAIAAERLQAASAAANPFAALANANFPPQLAGALMSQALGGAGNPSWLGQHLQAQALYPNARDQALAAFAAGQKRQSASDFARFGLNPSSMSALEQLQQLGNAYGASQGNAVAQQQAAAAAAALGMQAPLPGGQNGDSAAANGGALANSMPATAAMNAAAGKNSNMFDGNTNLKSLVNEQPQQQGGQRTANQNLINRLPSSGTIFPDSVSNPSLSHLLQGGGQAGAAGNNAMSNNRLSSMISLSSYLSREPSLVDLLLASQPGGGQYNPALAAAAAGMSAPPPNPGGDDAKRFGNAPM
jgi:hypothetical protein